MCAFAVVQRLTARYGCHGAPPARTVAPMTHHGPAAFLHELGRAFQRLSGLLFLAVLVGLPIAILLPNSPGVVLVLAMITALLVRGVRRVR